MYFYFYVYEFLLLCLFLIVTYVLFCVFCFILFFCVLFFCKCVLYYCRWVSTQLQSINISYNHIIYHIYQNQVGIAGTHRLLQSTVLTKVLSLFRPFPMCARGTRWRNWLRHCATSRKVAGWIPSCVTGIFH